MKQKAAIFIISFSILTFCRSAVLSAEETAPNTREELSEQLEKSKELAGIWKDRVRSLTAERDEAYREIDSLRAQLTAGAVSGGRVLRQGEIETQPIQPAAHVAAGLEHRLEEQTARFDELLKQKQVSDQQIETLRAQLESLHASEAAAQPGELERLQSQNKLLQIQNEKSKLIENELAETKNYYSAETDRLKNENRSALQKAGELETTVASLESQLAAVHTEAETLSKLQAEHEALQRSYADLETQLRDMTDKAEAIERSNLEFRNREKESTEAIERLRAGIRSQLSEMQKLENSLEPATETAN